MKAILLGLAIAAGLMAADFQYTQRTEITGGSMKQMMGMLGRFAKGATDPVEATTYVSGGKMVNGTAKAKTIMDASAGTITSVDLDKKEYSVITFEEMLAALKNMSSKMQGKKPEAEMQASMRVDLQEKGPGKTVQGVSTKELIMTVYTDMKVKDAKSGQEATMTSTMENDMHMGKVPGSEALREFYQKMAGRYPMQQIPMQAMMQGGIDYKGLQEAAKKMAEFDGLPMFSVMRMSNAGMGGMPNTPPPQQTNSGRTAGDVARDNANADTNSATNEAVGAIAGRLGRFGGLARRNRPNVNVPEKKNEPAQAPAQASAPAAQPGSNVLVEVTSEVTSFSAAAIDPAMFQVPAGFKQVEHPMKKMAR